MTSSGAGPNAAMIEYWNEQGGPRFVAQGEMLDAQLAPVGRRAIESARIATGERVLDVGCGCGQTALQIAERVGTTGAVVGLDVSEPMLTVAKRRAGEASLANVSFVQADAQVAPLDPDFDLVFSRFGIMFFEDPVAAFANLKKALVPDGRVAFVCWQPLPNNPWMLVPLSAAAKHLPMGPPPEPGAPGPFSFADPERVEGILRNAGFAEVSIEGHDSHMTLGAGGDVDRATEVILEVGPIANPLREHPDARPRVLAAVREALEPYQTAEGVKLASAVWLVTAR